ncbi:uncharacterized protein LOC124122935 [Haliotis rufescens]|uniref:uncharacterized protein LOC124122935 n=1 Tax=Haliotis rufescens TaxID=6454 RepID=UPI00201F121E|nr:uncharacterized protein LOC124122935 [Haliotis rufescens]
MTSCTESVFPVSEVKSDLASVKSRQEETDEKFDELLEQMQSIKSGTKGEEGKVEAVQKTVDKLMEKIHHMEGNGGGKAVSEMKSELTSFGLQQKETETKLQDISSKVDRAMKALKIDVSNLALRKPAYGSRDLDQYSNPNHVVDGDKHGIRIRDQCFTSARDLGGWLTCRISMISITSPFTDGRTVTLPDSVTWKS